MQKVDGVYRLNIERLVADLGGPAALAKSVGVPRTAPYRWLKRRFVSSPILERIKDAHPELDIDSYFTPEQREGRDGACST